MVEISSSNPPLKSLCRSATELGSLLRDEALLTLDQLSLSYLGLGRVRLFTFKLGNLLGYVALLSWLQLADLGALATAKLLDRLIDVTIVSLLELFGGLSHLGLSLGGGPSLCIMLRHLLCDVALLTLLKLVELGACGRLAQSIGVGVKLGEVVEGRGLSSREAQGAADGEEGEEHGESHVDDVLCLFL